MDAKQKKRYWDLIRIAAVLVTALCLSPLVIPPNTYTPTLAGMPYSLWTSLLVCVVLLLLTYLGTLVMPEE
ncbi:MAG: hypothetical protein D6730_17855 [Bacteroidetes bacterium]|nr:MAG: hypothetical protein D6730_17855 [Bacteroidota bacterium]